MSLRTPNLREVSITFRAMAEVPRDEIRRETGVGADAADQGRRKDHVLRTLGFEERLDLLLPLEVELGMRAKKEIGVATGLQPANDRASHQSAVARHEYP